MESSFCREMSMLVNLVKFIHYSMSSLAVPISLSKLCITTTSYNVSSKVGDVLPEKKPYELRVQQLGYVCKCLFGCGIPRCRVVPDSAACP